LGRGERVHRGVAGRRRALSGAFARSFDRHRDVKPENLYLHRAESRFESVVKVMDFGVAAVVGEREPARHRTPRYMAPEQVTGGCLSPQTDQYALALVIYEMLTGRLPWDLGGRDALARAEVRRRVAPAPPSRFCPWLPERMEAALLKALSKDPAARHETVHGLMFELRGLQSVNDRSTSGADDTHSTVPMVGTLAERGSMMGDDLETLVRMSCRPSKAALWSCSRQSPNRASACGSPSTRVKSRRG